MKSSVDYDVAQIGAVSPPLIVHVIFHLGVGGLENGLVNLINHMPVERYRHAIICLKGYSAFHKRLNRSDIEIISLNKREGKDLSIYGKLYREFKRLEPDIVHTRNLTAIEAQLVAAIAGVKGRVHGEHGRDIFDLEGKNKKYNLLRKTIRPFIHHFTAVSKDLENWLINTVGASREKVHQIYNGVEHHRFHADNNIPINLFPSGFFDHQPFVIGSVGRMAAVKDFPTLVRAFVSLQKNNKQFNKRPLRLVMIGDGVAKAECEVLLREAGVQQLAWLPGERNDVPELMRGMDLFVLPSLAEGISNTILEAMATGLPVVATQVGGNAELVQEGDTGLLVPPGDVDTMARAINKYCQNTEMVRQHGQRARGVIEQNFSMAAMTQGYLDVYDQVLH